MRNKKQTAVEWLERRYYFTKGQLIDIDFEKAKELEKQQIFEAIDFGYKLEDISITKEEYYTETYEERRNK